MSEEYGYGKEWLIGIKTTVASHDYLRVLADIAIISPAGDLIMMNHTPKYLDDKWPGLIIAQGHWFYCYPMSAKAAPITITNWSGPIKEDK